MGQKANLNGLHLCLTKDWNSAWYSLPFEYSKIVHEDFLLFKFLRSLRIYKITNKKVSFLNIVKLRICRTSLNILVELHFSFGLRLKRKKRQRVFFKKWKKWKKIKIFNVINKAASTINSLLYFKQNIHIVSLKLSFFQLKDEVNFITRKIAFLLENRVKFRSRLIKKIILETKKSSYGIFVLCSGRFNVVDSARHDFISKGSVPFQSLQKNIHYGFAVANTTKGLLSVKVSVFKKNYVIT